MIAGVCYCLNEADIIADSVSHHLAEGLGRIYVAAGPSADGTLEILAPFLETRSGFTRLRVAYDQQEWTDRMAALAPATARGGSSPSTPTSSGPRPADSPPTFAGSRTPSALRSPSGASTATGYHLRRGRAAAAQGRLPLEPLGAHWPGQPHGRRRRTGFASAIVAHHLMFRSAEQFAAKVRQRNGVMPGWARDAGHGWHIARYDGLSDGELRDAWQKYLALPHHGDPFPLATRTCSSSVERRVEASRVRGSNPRLSTSSPAGVPSAAVTGTPSPRRAPSVSVVQRLGGLALQAEDEGSISS